MKQKLLCKAFGAGLLGAAVTVNRHRLLAWSNPVRAEGPRIKTMKEASASEGVPCLRFGAIADVQYADVDDAWNFARTQHRRYRGTIDVLQSAVQEWRRDSSIRFVFDLGDIIDQQCETNGDSHECLQRVLHEWVPLKDIPIYHLIGNHELYNFNREECKEKIPNIYPWYRSFTPVKGWRFIVLDSYEINIAEKGGGNSVEDGIAYLSQHNPNDLRAPRGSVDLLQGLKGLQRRFAPMGGGMRQEQLQWLEQELQQAHKSCEKAVICTHVPLHPEATVPGALLWNYDEVLNVLQKVGGDLVALVLAGHYHPGGYAFDETTGTHHLTLPSPLHAAPGELAHCCIDLWHNRIEVHGRGLISSVTLPLRTEPPAESTQRAKL